MRRWLSMAVIIVISYTRVGIWDVSKPRIEYLTNREKIRNVAFFNNNLMVKSMVLFSFFLARLTKLLPWTLPHGFKGRWKKESLVSSWAKLLTRQICLYCPMWSCQNIWSDGLIKTWLSNACNLLYYCDCYISKPSTYNCDFLTTKLMHTVYLTLSI